MLISESRFQATTYPAPPERLERNNELPGRRSLGPAWAEKVLASPALVAKRDRGALERNKSHPFGGDSVPVVDGHG
jgi:hypothetical protein